MFPTKIRVALWKANQQRCFYCSDPISYRDLEIDHLVPQKIQKKELENLCQRIALPMDFDPDALYNLVPAHHNCNNRKAGDLFTDKTLLFYLEIWAKKQKNVNCELQRFERSAAHDQHLIAIAKSVESGEITKQQIVQFVASIPRPANPKPSEPLVITFGANVSELTESHKLPREAGETYPIICDWLEKDLVFRLSGTLPVLFRQAEASERNGETLSVRIAFWNLDLDRLDQFDLSHWTILEIANFSELYGESPPDELLARAVVKASADVVADPWDTVFGVGRCPRCGSEQLKRYSTTDHHYDEIYHTIECRDCGWLEWTQ
jgi:predicted RNA-binding Zn-ribbon protein involved in translation (DUF1610 family)